MPALFSPVIAGVVDVARSVALGDAAGVVELKKSLEEARQFMNKLAVSIDSLSPMLFTEGKGEENFKFLQDDFKALNRSLKELSEVLEKERFFEINSVVYSIEKYAGRLSDSSRNLAAAAEATPPESPFPVINYILKVAYKHTSNKLPITELSNQFSTLVAFIKSLELRIELFASLHPEEEKLNEACNKLLQDLQQAAGAIKLYLEEGTPLALVDALRIFRYATPPLYILLRKMDRTAALSNKHSKILPIDLFCTAYTAWKDGKISDQQLLAALAPLKKLVLFYEETLHFVSQFHYLCFIEDDYKKVQLGQTAFTSFWNSFCDRASKLDRNLDLNLVVTRFETRDREINELVARLEAEISACSGAPYIEEIKEMVARFISGALVLEYFSTRLEMFAQAQRDMIYDFKKRTGGNELASELCQLLDLQKEGVDEMMQFFDDSDRVHLLQGIKLLEEPLPRLIEIAEGIAKPQRNLDGICPSCGAKLEASSKLCSRCGRTVPTVLYNEISQESDETENLPSKLKTIVKLVKEFNAGVQSKDSVVSELENYIGILQKVQNDFDRALSRFQRSQATEVRDAAESFASDFDNLVSAANNLLDAVENSSDLEAPLSQLTFAAVSLDELRSIVRESKRVLASGVK